MPPPDSRVRATAPEAVAAFEEYLGWMPNDVEAKRALAVSYHATGEKEIVGWRYRRG